MEFVLILFCFHGNRDAPEATGDEPEDADFDMPKIYEPVSSLSFKYRNLNRLIIQYNLL